MTQEELQAVKFHFKCHVTHEKEYTQTYESEDGRFAYCDHTHRLKNGQLGKTYRHYRIGTKIYKTRSAFLAALKDVTEG